MTTLADALRITIAHLDAIACGVVDDAPRAARIAAEAAREALAAHDAAVSAGGWIDDGDSVSVQVVEDAPTYIAPICYMDEDWTPELKAAYAARIVACVNACTGIADPAALVAAARDALALADARERSLGCLSEEYAKVQAALRNSLVPPVA